MKYKAIISEDFNNFKTCSMFIGFPTCTWKCGAELCQNSDLARSPNHNLDYEEIFEIYDQNPISHAIVCGGLEPFDSFKDLYMLIVEFRKHNVNDYFVIYTGYNREELTDELKQLAMLPNIIVKFGRFLPNHKSHFDEVLGVDLSSDNQYAEVIS